MSDLRFTAISALVCFIAVHSFYLVWVDPAVATATAEAKILGENLPRTFAVIVKDVEQQICISLLLLGLSICAYRAFELNSDEFLYDVDILADIDLSDFNVRSLNEFVLGLPANVKRSSLVEIMTASMRRFLLTRSIESAANSLEPSLDTLSIKHEGQLAPIRFIVWAVPSIGFLGTVRGIGLALAQADEAVGGNIAPMTESLGVAFNSTFVALIISIILTFVLSGLQRQQDNRLVQIQAYVEETLIKKIADDEKTS